MKKIVIIAIYFGSFPNHHRLFEKSVEENPTIDFKIFTDQNIVSSAKNFEYINIDMDWLNNEVKKNLNQRFKIVKPYKCCDFKPVYGIIFRDYIKKYDFWGHCDLDLIFGDIRRFVTEDILKKYDKILPLGHLSLYRNTREVNSRYKDYCASCGKYDEIFSSEKNFAFDEWRGIMDIYYKREYPFYDKRVFADISTLRRRFTLALEDKNYKQQVFYWENGHIYRAYFDGEKINRDEFAYIHFKQRKYLENHVTKTKPTSFYICDKGFIPKQIGLPTRNDIMKYNHYPGLIPEYLETTVSRLKRVFNKIRSKLTI